MGFQAQIPECTVWKLKTLKAEVHLSIHLALYLPPVENSTGCITAQVRTLSQLLMIYSTYRIASVRCRVIVFNRFYQTFAICSCILGFHCDTCKFLGHTTSCQQKISHLNCTLCEEVPFMCLQPVTCWFHLIPLNFCTFSFLLHAVHGSVFILSPSPLLQASRQSIQLFLIWKQFYPFVASSPPLSVFFQFFYSD